MAIVSPFDILDKKFMQSAVFQKCRHFHEQERIELVLIDTLGKIHFSDPSDADTVSRVYQALTVWFPETTIIVNAHNRKSNRDSAGNEIMTEDDFMGNRKWADDAVVQLQMRKYGAEFKSRLYHAKSQVAVKIEPIDLYIDIHGNVELWQENRSHIVINRFLMLKKRLGEVASTETLIQAYMSEYQCSRRTAYRVRAMVQNRHKI